MKGTDVPQVALDEAKQFLEMITGSEWEPDDKTTSISREKMIRVLAWYGEIRAEGGRKPGYLAKEPRTIRERFAPENDKVSGGRTMPEAE